MDIDISKWKLISSAKYALDMYEMENLQKFFAFIFQGDKSYFMLISFYFAILSFLFNKLTLILIWGVFRVLRLHMSSYTCTFFLEIFFNTKKNREKYLILFFKKKNYELMPYDEKRMCFHQKNIHQRLIFIHVSNYTLKIPLGFPFFTSI